MKSKIQYQVQIMYLYLQLTAMYSLTVLITHKVNLAMMLQLLLLHHLLRLVRLKILDQQPQAIAIILQWIQTEKYGHGVRTYINSLVERYLPVAVREVAAEHRTMIQVMPMPTATTQILHYKQQLQVQIMTQLRQLQKVCQM